MFDKNRLYTVSLGKHGYHNDNFVPCSTFSIYQALPHFSYKFTSDVVLEEQSSNLKHKGIDKTNIVSRFFALSFMLMLLRKEQSKYFVEYNIKFHWKVN